MKLFDLTKREKLMIGAGGVVISIMMGQFWAAVGVVSAWVLAWTLKPRKEVFVKEVGPPKTEDKK